MKYWIYAIILLMKQYIIFTEEALVFAKSLDDLTYAKLGIVLEDLSNFGRLVYPDAEKVHGYDGLFAIRIRTKVNARFFYCYAVGNEVYILSGYSKKTNSIPVQELKKALNIKRGLGL